MKQIWSVKWAILFTDIKDFTLKSSLLTSKQIGSLLNKQWELVLPILKKYFWQVVKELGDSYMVVFENAENAALASIEIQKKLWNYNSKTKLNLYKLELRITIDYWILDRKSTSKWEDYFWTPVNLASRLQSKTPENCIFITSWMYDEVIGNKEIETIFLWKTTFKWILFEVWVHKLIFWDACKTLHTDKKIDEYFVSEESKKTIENIDSSIFKFASVAAIIWIQPIPFLDIYWLLLLHLYLLNQISKEYWITLTKEESKEVITTVMWSVTGSYLLSHGLVWLSKIGLVWIGWYIMMPLNFALTYSIWKILSFYLYKKSQWLKSSNSELKTLFKYSMVSWKSIAKKDKDKILNIGKKYKDWIVKKIKDMKINLDFFKNKK